MRMADEQQRAIGQGVRGGGAAVTETTPAEAGPGPSRLTRRGWLRKTETQLPRGREGERGEACGGMGAGLSALCPLCLVHPVLSARMPTEPNCHVNSGSAQNPLGLLTVSRKRLGSLRPAARGAGRADLSLLSAAP